MPRLRAALTPIFACRTTLTSGEPRASTASAEPSVEPSSTTIISDGSRLCAKTERTARSTSRRLL